MADLYDRLVKLLKQNDEISQAKAAEKLGVSLGQVNMLAFCKAKVEAGIVKKAPATAKSVKDLRRAGDRWEMIAARTGLSVAKVRDLFGGEEVARTSSVGRGRPPSGVKRNTTRPSAGSKTKTAGSKKKAAAARTTVRRATTRAARRGGNPS
jgi:hypothetical protein